MRLVSLKKFLPLIFTIFLFSSSVQAKTLKAEALDDFLPKYPKGIFRVKILETQEIKKDSFIDAGTIICGQVIAIKGPQRGKRDGYIEFVPIEITCNGVTQKIEQPVIAARVSGYKPINPKELTFNVMRKTANFFFKGAISAVEFIDGAIEAENGQRIKSGVMKVYKDSPLSYIETGKELNVKTGDILTLKLKNIR